MERNVKSIMAMCFVAASMLTSCGGGGDMVSKIMAAKMHGAKPYKTMKVTTSDRTLQKTYSASIKGRQDIDIYPQVGGILQKLCVTEGQRVTKGQTLFIIDQVPYQAALNTAEAALEAAKAQEATAKLNYESRKKLFDEQVVSEFDMQTAQNTYLSAKAAVAQATAQVTNARNSLSYTVVKSPANGVVGTLPYRQGALVSAQLPQPLTTVSDNNEMYVYFSMNENQVLSLTRQYGSPEKAASEMPEIKLQLSDGSEYAHTGKVETISGVVDKATGSVSFRAVFPNPDHLLQSGASGAVIIPEEYKDMIVVPQSAVFQRQDKYYVYKVTQTTEDVDIYAADGSVTRGRAWVANSAIINVVPNNNGTEYIVSGGLEAGEEIIAEGAGMAREGDQVKK